MINLEDTGRPISGIKINDVDNDERCEGWCLTYGSFGAYGARVSHGMQYRPVTIDGHRHQAEDADGAEDHEDRDGKETGI